MPSLRDLVSTGVPLGLDYLNRRRATGTATTTLVNGTNTAAGTLNTAAGNVNDIYRRTYDDQLRMLDPYRRAGEDWLKRLTDATAQGGELDKTFDQQFAFDPSKIAETPGYQFRLNEGIKALERSGAARGILDSGAIAKQIGRYGQDYASNELQNEFNRQKSVYDTTFDVFRANQNDRFSRLRDLTGIGQSATSQAVAAGSQFADRTAQSMQLNAQQIADLQTQAANARAAGNVAGANALSDVISRGVATVQDLDLLKKLGLGGASSLTTAARFAPGVTSLFAPAAASAASMASIATPSLAAITAGTVPQIPLAATVGGQIALGGSAAGGAAGTAGGAAGTAGSGGLTGAITGFLTNPITIGVGAALAAGIIWKKSQVHPTADTFVKKFQDPFVNNQGTGILNRLVDGFNQTASSGSLTREQALQLRAEIQDLTNHFEQQRQEFAAKGSKERTVAEQAQQTMNQYYGPNFSGLFGKIDQAIAQLGGHA